MGIIIIKDEEQDLTLHEATGPISEVEVYDALQNFYKQNLTSRLLWNISQADVSHVTSDIL